MEFEWNEHRFSGGVLVLDLANTVVHRNKPDMRLDRLDTPHRFAGFAEAASHFRHAEIGGIRIVAPVQEKDRQAVQKLRETADHYFRSDREKPFSDASSATSLKKLFAAASNASRAASTQNGAMPLGLACALSAMRLLGSDQQNTIRACPNCDWLFLDKSKNGSRRWCDMAVCGNRAKAAKHYRSKIAEALT